MKPTAPHGLVNHYTALAAKLPAPCSVGLWQIVEGVRFQVVAGHDENGAPALAWEAMPTTDGGTGLFFRAMAVSA